MTVSFCGHKEILHNYIKEQIYVETEKLIISGAKKFLLGGYGSFDYLAAKTLKSLKLQYPHIESVIVLPYINKKYAEDLYDYSLYPPIETVLPRFAITARNKWMVDNSDIVVAYVYHSGGAEQTLKYAQRKNKTIIIL